MKNIIPIEKFTSTSDSIFKNISNKVKKEIENQMIDKIFKKNQQIFLEGSFPSGVFYLKEGLVKKYKTDNLGKEHILYLCSNGELIGYSALLCNEAFPDSASALETSKLGFLPKEIFNNIINSSSELMLNVLSSLSHEFGVMVNSVTVFANMTVKERLALMLLILAAKFKQRNVSSFEIVLSRNDLASLVGTATETLIRMLQIFKKEGIIEIKSKKIIILKTKELINISKFY